MNVQGLFITRTKAEVLSGFLAGVSLVVGVVPAIIAQETRIATLLILALFFLGALGWFGALIARPSFTIRGYNGVMTLLAKLAKTSRYKLWTVRSHTGPGTTEGAYFEAIEDRLTDRVNPLEDFRRVVRLCPSSYDHLVYLISRFYRQDNVSVRYYQNCGPQFDFMIVDGRIGVIGFPMVGGKGNIGALVIRRRGAVEGLEIIFQELCRESTLLFEGDGRHAPQIEADLQKTLTKIFSKLVTGGK